MTAGRAGARRGLTWARTLPVRRAVRYYAAGLYRQCGDLPVFVLASGLAFTLLLSTFPLVLIAVYVLGTVLDLAAVQRQMDLMVRTVVPYQLHADYLSRALTQRAGELLQHRHVYGILGAVGLLAVASGMFGTMRTILNEVYQVQRRRSMMVNRLHDATMVFLVVCFVLVLVAAAPAMEAFMDTAHAGRWLEPLRLGAGAGLLYALLSSGTFFLAFFAMYGLLPDERPARGVAAFSALWAALLWELAAQLFGYYISHVATLRRVYGAYALVVAVAMWIYYASLVFVVAALLGQLYRDRRGRPLPADAKAAPEEPAAALRRGGTCADPGQASTRAHPGTFDT